MRRFACSLLCLAVMMGCGHSTVPESARQHQEVRKERPPNTLEAKNPPKVTADRMFTAYNTNAGSPVPDQSYKGQLLHVSAVLDGFNRRRSGQTYLELRTHAKGAFVYAAMLPQEFASVASLKPGTELDMICWSLGQIGGSPMLADCHLTEMPSSNQASVQH